MSRQHRQECGPMGTHLAWVPFPRWLGRVQVGVGDGAPARHFGSPPGSLSNLALPAGS